MHDSSLEFCVHCCALLINVIIHSIVKPVQQGMPKRGICTCGRCDRAIAIIDHSIYVYMYHDIPQRCCAVCELYLLVRLASVEVWYWVSIH